MNGQKASPADAAFIAGLYERYMGIMYKTALEHIGDPSRKEAVVHDALLRLWKKLDVLQGLDERSLPVYIASVVRYVALEDRRRTKRERQLIVPEDIGSLSALSDGASLEDDYAEREAQNARLRYMRQALEELSDDDRALLLGKYASGRSDEELARMLGVRPDSIRKKLHRARQRAQRIILRKEAEGR